MSTHAVEIVQLGDVIPIPDTDTLGTTMVWGWQCVVKRSEFRKGDLAVYVPPDFEVPTSRLEFSFLGPKERCRIKVRKLRGQISQGLLIPLSPALTGLPVGTNVMDLLGITRYEPPEPLSTGGQFERGPSGVYAPKFDVESYQRYRHLIPEGTPVIITEKLHGANARFVWGSGDSLDAQNYRMFCGSRNHWMQQDPSNLWWRALSLHPAIETWCRANPGNVLYGEVFGQVQDLKYGAPQNAIYFRAFAATCATGYWPYGTLLRSLDRVGVMPAPVLYLGPFLEASTMELAEQNSSILGAQHEREGVVIVPLDGRESPEIGRVALKIVSNRYLGR